MALTKIMLCLTLVTLVDSVLGTHQFCKRKIDRHVLLTATRSPLINDSTIATVALGDMEAILLEIMSEHLNFTYEVRPPKDILSAGNHLSDGSWTGATGQLQRQEVEWSVSTAAPTYDKRRITDTSLPVTFVDTCILIPFPHEDGKIVALFDAFEATAWIGVLVFFVVFIISAWTLQRFTNDTNDKSQDSISFWTVHFISVWTTQGVTLRNKSLRFRFALGICFLGIYLLSNYYTGAYTSLLSVPSFVAPIRSIEELANSKTFKTLLLKGSSTDEYIMTTKDPTYKKIADQMRKYPQRRVLNALTVEDISSLVRDNHALIITKSSGDSLIQKSYELNGNKCKVTMAEQTFFSRPQSYSLLKDSNLTCTVDFELLILQEVGLIHYADKKSQTDRNPCSLQNVKASASSRPIIMNVYHFTGAFFVLAAGCSISTLVFLLELVVFNVKRM